MKCPGCYKIINSESYCPACRKQLFDGRKIKHVLPFDMPKAYNLPFYQEKTKRLSISGVQLKYSLRIEEKELLLTEKKGQYILKPIPPGSLILHPDQAPENEHLTMQIAAKVYNIPTAANALIYFKDGAPAYITRRFDVKKDGSKYLQEDMAQLGGRTKNTFGPNFKYEGSYEEIGRLIQKYVAAAPPALEHFFKLVLFNYLFSNGDAHLKNFSLLQTDMGDYTLAPAYDLMATVIHTPHESDTALELFHGDIQSTFYSTYGFLGQAHFRELAQRLGIIPVRYNRIITQMLSSGHQVHQIINNSLLSEEVKLKYLNAYNDKVRRMGMTQAMIARAIDPVHPSVYAPTNAPATLYFMDGTTKTGYFQHREDFEKLAAQNEYTFIELINKNKQDPFTIISGDVLINVKYPSIV